MMQSKFTTFFVLTRLFLLSAPVLIILIVLVTYLTDPVYYKSELSPVIEVLAASLILLCGYLLYTEKNFFSISLAKEGIYIKDIVRRTTKRYNYTDVTAIKYESTSEGPQNKRRAATDNEDPDREKTYIIQFSNGDTIYLSLENYKNAEELCKFISLKRLS